MFRNRPHRLDIPPGKVHRYGQHLVGLRSLEFVCGVHEMPRLFLETVLLRYGLPPNIDGAIDLMKMAVRNMPRIGISRRDAFYNFLQNEPFFLHANWDRSEIEETYEHLKHLARGRARVRRTIDRVSLID